MSVDLTKDKWPERMGTDDPVAGIYITHAEYNFARHRVEMFEELVKGLDIALISAHFADPQTPARKLVADNLRALLAKARGDKTP